jgi:hypothetical protein
MKLNWFFFLIIVVVSTACSHSDKKVEAFEPFLKSKLQLNKYLSANYSLGLFKYYYDTKSKEEYFTYPDENNKSIVFITLNDTAIVKTISVDQIPDFGDYDILSFDSVYFIYNSSRSISLLANEKLQSWKIKSAIPIYGNEYEINTWYHYPLSHNEGEILVYNSPLEVLKTNLRFSAIIVRLEIAIW